jgi:hypothetical protein
MVAAPASPAKEPSKKLGKRKRVTKAAHDASEADEESIGEQNTAKLLRALDM